MFEFTIDIIQLKDFTLNNWVWIYVIGYIINFVVMARIDGKYVCKQEEVGTHALFSIFWPLIAVLGIIVIALFLLYKPLEFLHDLVKVGKK